MLVLALTCRLALAAVVFHASLAAAAPRLPEPVLSRSDRRSGVACVIESGVTEPGQLSRAVAQFAYATLGFPRAVPRAAPTDAQRADALAACTPPEDGPALLYLLGSHSCAEDVVDAVLRFARTGAGERIVIIDGLCERTDDPWPKAAAQLFAAGAQQRAHVGALTTFLLQGLRGPADLDGDGDVRFAELAAHVRTRMARVPVTALHLRLSSGDAVAVREPVPTPSTRPGGAEGPAEVEVRYAGVEGRLFVDGQPAGNVPRLLTGLAPGEHWLEVQGKTHTSRGFIFVAPGERRSVVLPLGERRMFDIAVESVPTGATVSLNGRELGVTPLRHLVSPGRYSLELEHRGFNDARRELEVLASDVSQTVALDPERNALSWTPLFPQVEYVRRIWPRLWLGGRLHFIQLGFGPSTTGLLRAGIYVGGALIVRYPLYDLERSAHGVELMGGLGVDYGDDLRNFSGGGRDELFFGSTVGVAYRFYFLEPGLELRTAMTLRNGFTAYLLPRLSVRHFF